MKIIKYFREYSIYLFIGGLIGSYTDKCYPFFTTKWWILGISLISVVAILLALKPGIFSKEEE